MGFLRRHRSLFFPTSNEAAAGGAGVSSQSSGAAAYLDVPPSPNETKLRRRKSFFEVLGFGKKRASKRQSMSAAASSKSGRRPRSATVGDYQQQKTNSDIPPVPPLPPLPKKVGNVAAVQLDDLELDDDHMAAITAVVNNSSRDEPPEHLFLNIPGSNEPGSRLSVASKRASTISTHSTNSVNQPQQQRSTSDSTANGRQSRRSSLRNSLLVVKDLPDLPSGPSGRPITPTRARAAPPSSYAPPPESIAQRLEAANVTPEPSLSAPSTPSKSTPSTPTRPRAEQNTPTPASELAEDSAKTASAAPTAAKPAEQLTEEPTKVEQPAPAQPIAADELTPELIETPKHPVEVASPSAPIEEPTVIAAEDSVPNFDTNETESAAVVERSPASPESDLDPSDIPEIPADDEPVVATAVDVGEPAQPAIDDTTPKAEQPSFALSPSTEAPATPPRSPVTSEVSKDAPIVQTPDEEVPGQSWSSSSHPSTPSMLPHTPVGDETAKPPAIASGEDSPLVTPQRTGSPVAVKQRQVSAPVSIAPIAPLIKEPQQKEKAPTNEKAPTTQASLASSIGKGAPPVSQRYSQLRSVSLPTPGGQRRLSSPPTPKAGEDPSLDDFVGLMKQVISREKGMSIRDAARAAEQRKSSVPV